LSNKIIHVLSGLISSSFFQNIILLLVKRP
jgi:hypothetical protein